MVLVSKSKRHAPRPSKRQQGRHHKHSDPYLKTYWPYLPLVAIVILGLAFSGFLGRSNKDVLGYATEMSISSLLQQTNTERAANGLGGLAVNALLNQAAQAKANDMATRDYWSHNTPEGNPPWVFFTNAGYQYQAAGENLAYGFDTSGNAVAGWMASPGHKANILNTTYTEVGFGYANSPNYQGTGPETIVVAEYGSPQVLASAPAASQPIAAAPAPKPTPAPVAETPAPAPSEQPVATEPTAAEANTTPLTSESASPVVGARNVSRIQLLASGNAAWSMFAVSAAATICIFVFFLRHALFWHRTLVRGEAFIVHHKLLDITLVAVAVLGFVLTRSAGVIH